jgi:hypothetical protein
MKSVIIVGGGSSIQEGIDKRLWDKIKGREVWSLNSAFRTMPYNPTRQLWVDYRFFEHNAHYIQVMGSQGVKLTCKAHRKYAFIGDVVEQKECCRQREFYGEGMKNVPLVFIGGHGLSGCFALSLAVLEDYDIAYILGYDWGTTSVNQRKTHYYQDKIKDLNIYSRGAGNPEIYLEKLGKIFIKDFDLYLKEKIKIYNVSPNSNLYQFEKIDYDNFFERIANE